MNRPLLMGLERGETWCSLLL